MKRLLTAALCALCLLLVPGCGLSPLPAASAAASSAAASSAAVSSAPAASSSASASAAASASSSAREPAAPTHAERAAALTRTLTLEEKVGQLFFARCPADSAAADAASFHLGGYLLFGRDFRDLTANEIIQTLRAYQDAAQADTGIPLLLGTDEEGGTVVRVSSNPRLCKEPFRSPQQLLSDGGLEELVGETREKDVLLRALGINVNFAPVCDVSTDPGDFIHARSMGLDAKGTASCAAAVVAQMSQDGMGSVLKHFPGYGNNADTHTGVAVDARPLQTFETSDFLPFRSALAADEGAGGRTAAVLVCHNIVQCMDKTLPASLSPAVHQILRQQLGFGGVIMTDDLAMDAVKAYAQNGDAATLALLAGNDLLVTTDYRAQIPQVLSAVESGALPESVIDEACTRVLTWKMDLGLL
jgi:beta-N-acetylhexosaminidase